MLLCLGLNPNTNVTRTQFHTPIPSGTFSMNIPNLLAPVIINYDSTGSAAVIKSALESSSNDVIVDVTVVSATTNTFYSWAVKFRSPVGNVPTIILDATGISSAGVTASVTILEQGDSKTLWFDPIPTWMLEIPLAWSTNNKVRSNVEVYVKSETPYGTDVLKAVCDGSGTQGAGYVGFAKGNEKSCGFSYALNNTALVFSSHVTGYASNDTTLVSITGVGFAKSASNNTKLSVAIGSIPCVIINNTDSSIVCSIQNVPAGTYAPVVNVPGLGFALDAVNSSVTFVQQVYSVTQQGTSVAGGGILEFSGRGFQLPSRIEFLSVPIPTMTPTYVTTYSPNRTMKPTKLPTCVPTLKPSSFPSIKPSYAPSGVLSPTIPTFSPSAKPTFKPTQIPTFKPSRAPTSTPNYSKSPSTIPTIAPTLVPSKPTITPTVVPTRTPSFAPSYSKFVTICLPFISTTSKIQCHLPALPETYLPLLSGSSDGKKAFGIILNGVPLVSFPSLVYSITDTPVVDKVTPQELSFANSMNLLIQGKNFINTTSVMVGASPCKLNNVTNSTINCQLLRDRNVSLDYLQTLTVDVSNKGYAADSESITELPTVERGFHITNLSTHHGSYYGGNVLSISGVGFTETNRSKYQVILIDQSTGIDIISLNEVLKLLGQPVIGNQYVECDIIAVSYSMINCTLPHFVSTNIAITINTFVSTIDATYKVVVSANGVNSLCYDPQHIGDAVVNSTVCLYQQSTFSTPIINTVSETAISANNEVSVTLHGSFLSAASSGVTVWIGSEECSVLSVSENTISIKSPPLIAGLQNVTLLVHNVGYANSDLQVAVGLVIYQLISVENVVAVNASIGGGLVAKLIGAGFNATNCHSNIVTLTVDHAYTSVTTTDGIAYVISCTESEIYFELPSVANIISSSSSFSRILKVSVTVGSMKSTFSNFQWYYSVDATPLVQVSSVSGYVGKILLATVPITSKLLLTTTDLFMQFGETNCESISTVAYPTNVTIHCTVPSLSAGYHDVYLYFSPVGYALVNNYRLSLPKFQSLLSVQPLSLQNVNPSGGKIVTIQGKGFSDATNVEGANVTVCGVICPIISSNYNTLKCRLPTYYTTTTVDDISILGESIYIDLYYY